MPAFRVDMAFAGCETTSWVTDTGEVVREESPLGLMTVRESPERAQALAVPGRVQADLLEAAAVVPDDAQTGSTSRATCGGSGCGSRAPTSPAGDSTAPGRRSTATSSRSSMRGRCTPGRARCRRRAVPAAGAAASKATLRRSAPRPSGGAAASTDDRAPGRAADAPRQRAARQEADRQPAVGARSAADQGRRLQRAHGAVRRDGAIDRHPGAHRRRPGVHARRVLLPRLARGLHLDEGRGRGLWLPVDPTFNQFPADATHVRLARGGLDKQAGDPSADRPPQDDHPRPRARARLHRRSWSAATIDDRTWRRCAIAASAARACRCWSSCPGQPRQMIAIHEPGQAIRHVHGGRRRQPRRAPGRDPRLPRPQRRRQDDDDPDDRRAAEADVRAHPRQRPRPGDASPRRRRRRSASSPIGRSSTRS